MQGSACLVDSFVVPKKTEAPGLIRLTRKGSWFDWPRIKLRGKSYQVAEPVIDLEAAKLLRRYRVRGWQVTWNVYKALGVILGNDWNMGKARVRTFRRCLSPLAQLAGVSKATISAHLRILQDLEMLSIQGKRFRTYTLLTPKDHTMKRRNKPSITNTPWVPPVIDRSDLDLLSKFATGNKTIRNNVAKVYDTLWVMSQSGKDGWAKFQDSNVQKISEAAGLSVPTVRACIKQLQVLKIIEKTIGCRKRTFKILSIKLWIQTHHRPTNSSDLMERNMNELTIASIELERTKAVEIDAPTVLPFIIRYKENPSEEIGYQDNLENQESNESSTKHLDEIVQRCKSTSHELFKKRAAREKEKYGKVSSDVFEHEWHCWMIDEYPGYVPYQFSAREYGMANHFLVSLRKSPPGVADAFLYEVSEGWLKFARESEWINFPRHFTDGPVWQIVFTFKSKFLHKAYRYLHREWIMDSMGLSETDADVAIIRNDSRTWNSPYHELWRSHSAKASKRGYGRHQKQMDAETNQFLKRWHDEDAR